MIFAGLSEGKCYFFGHAVSVSVNQEMFVPADDISIIFPYTDNFPFLERIYALEDNVKNIRQAIGERNVLFDGIVDEQVFKSDRSGTNITVYARSPAAFLVDNECEPAEYINPSEDVIFARHLTPFGIEMKKSGKKCRNDRLRINKGSSHYKILEKFCRDFLDSCPRIDSRGICRTDVYDSEKKIFFGSERGVGFDSVSVSRSRYSRISKIHVGKNGGYDTLLTNDDAEKAGIVRERYICLLDSKTGTLSDAYDVLENGETNSFSVSLKCSECLINYIGAEAWVDAEGCRGKKFVVSKIRFVSDGNGEFTKIKLSLKN